MSSAQSAAARLRVRSALNPMLWLCGIVTIPCFVLAYLLGGNGVIPISLILLGAVPVLTAVGGFIYFMIRSPEKLQSEEYQIRHQALELIRQKGSTVKIIPSSLEAITNPLHAPHKIGEVR
jgi:hypothetical protein